MATVTRENIGRLTDKIVVTVSKDDYLQSFDKNLKQYAKNANIPGFRKGMVPAGLVKKMYGQSVFTDEILRTVEKELNNYMDKEQLDIFAQPLPLSSDSRMLDMNNPGDYAFAFEIGLKPEFDISLDNFTATKYKVQITEEMVNEEINRLQVRHGKMTDPETVTGDDNVLNVNIQETDKEGDIVENGVSKSNSLLVKYFAEPVRPQLIGAKKDDSFVFQLSQAFDTREREWILGDLGLSKEGDDASKYFRFSISKVGLVEKAEMNPEFFDTAYPGRGINSEDELRNAVKVEIENQYEQQAKNQVHDQIYHHLVDGIHMDFPAEFLKRWMQTGTEKPKTEEEAEKEMPAFLQQLKWQLITTKLINDNKITVEQEEIHNHVIQQVLGYMGIQNMDDAPWIEDYVQRMMQDKKQMENIYFQIQTSKLFTHLESRVQTKDEAISADEFAHKLHHHHH